VRRLNERRQSAHGFSRVLLGEPHQEIGVRHMKVAFGPIISPRQGKYGDRTRTRGAVGMAIESVVEKHISRLDIDSAAESGFDKGAGKYNACVTVKVQVTCRCLAPRKYPKPAASRLVFE